MCSAFTENIGCIRACYQITSQTLNRWNFTRKFTPRNDALQTFFLQLFAACNLCRDEICVKFLGYYNSSQSYVVSLIVSSTFHLSSTNLQFSPNQSSTHLTSHPFFQSFNRSYHQRGVVLWQSVNVTSFCCHISWKSCPLHRGDQGVTRCVVDMVGYEKNEENRSGRKENACMISEM